MDTENRAITHQNQAQFLPFKKRHHTIAFSEPNPEKKVPFDPESDEQQYPPRKRTRFEIREIEEGFDQLRALFDYITSDLLSKPEGEWFQQGKSEVPETTKGRKMEKKSKKGWLNRGLSRLRREKTRLNKAIGRVFDGSLWRKEGEDEDEWVIEHVHDPFAFLSLPAPAFR